MNQYGQIFDSHKNCILFSQYRFKFYKIIYVVIIPDDFKHIQFTRKRKLFHYIESFMCTLG